MWPSQPKKVKFGCKPGEREKIAVGLWRRNVCGLVPEEEAIRCNGHAVINGLFGVGKGSLMTDPDTGELVEVLRCIMNLIPSNELQHLAKGDIDTLPCLGQWSSV